MHTARGVECAAHWLSSKLLVLPLRTSIFSTLCPFHLSTSSTESPQRGLLSSVGEQRMEREAYGRMERELSDLTHKFHWFINHPYQIDKVMLDPSQLLGNEEKVQWGEVVVIQA